MDPWLPLLQDLPLSKVEQEVVKRYKLDLEGRTFLPVADILRSYRLVDESIELLIRGVANHPKFTVARVVLARELFNKGMLVDAWKTLEESETPLTENVLAQKLKFRLAILLGYDSLIRSIIKHLQVNKMTDAEIDDLIHTFEVSGIQVTNSKLQRQLRNEGIQVVLPERATVEDSLQLSNSEKVELLEEDDSRKTNWIGGYQVMSLDEVFLGSSNQENDNKSVTSNGVELDSVTLAEIYEQQEHFEKALSVYRRLLRMNPASDLLKNKVANLAKKSKLQKHDDLSIDPSIADSMEQIEIIDIQARFYNSLLEKLS